MAKSIGATLKLKDGNFFANLKKASKELGTFDSKTSDAIKTLKGFGNSFKSVKSPVDGLKNSVIGLVSTYASLSAIKSIGGLSDEMSQTKARLDMVNDGLQTTDELNSMIFKSAKDSRGQYKATADLVTSLGNNCGTVFETTKETVAFAEQLNKRFAIAGASTEEASNAITQLSQGLAAGALRGDELNSVLEQAPNIARSIESYMGIAQGSIKKAAEEGLVTADVVKNAILSSADETNAQFEKMPMTWGQIWQNIKTTTLEKAGPILDTINKVANGEQFQGLVKKITDGIGQLAENGTIDKFANGIMTAADKAIEAIPRIAATIGEAVGFIKEHGNVISGILGAIGGGIIALKGLNFVKGIIEVVKALGTLKKAVGIGKLISVALGGPVGIVIVLIGALVGAFAVLWNKCEGFRNFWKNLGEGIKNVASKTWKGIKKATSTIGNATKKVVDTVWGGIKKIVSKTMDAAHETASNRLNKIKKAFEDNGGGIKGAAFAAWEGIKGFYTDGFNFVNNLTDGKLGELLKKFTDGFKPIIEAVEDAWQSLKDWWNRLWGIESTPTPEVEITPTATVLGNRTPTFSSLTSWNATGGIFRKPTVLSTNSGLQGFGEAGAEAVLPLTPFWNNLRKYLTERTVKESSTKTNNNKFYITVHADGKSVDEIIDEFVPKLKLKLANL